MGRDDVEGGGLPPSPPVRSEREGDKKGGRGGGARLEVPRYLTALGVWGEASGRVRYRGCSYPSATLAIPANFNGRHRERKKKRNREINGASGENPLEWVNLYFASSQFVPSFG